MPELLDETHLRAGIGSAESFWRALGRDDDGAVRDLLTESALARIDSEAGLAARIREELQIDPRHCDCLGAISPIPISEGYQMWPTFVFCWVPLEAPPDDDSRAWRIGVTETDGAWKVDPFPGPGIPEKGHRWISTSLVWSRVTAES